MGDEDVAADLMAAAGALLDAAAAPGAAICLLVDGETVLASGVGHRDLARTAPLAADARFPLYSVAKILLAVAALRLAEAGRLDLDAPIQTVLPGLPLAAPVTLRQALNHTGGLPDYGGMPAYHEDLRADPGNPWAPDEFLARTLPMGLRFPPGQGWAYSNIGYLLVRQAIERTLHRSLRDALDESIFRPLALAGTAVAESLADMRHATPGYSAALDGDGALDDISRRYHPGWVSHGLVLSTAPEAARIVEAVFAGRLLQPASLAAMLDAVPVPEEHHLIAQPGYGLGLMIDLNSPFGLVAGHGGGGPGYSTAAFHFPDVAGHRLTSVSLANRDQPDLGLDLAFALARTAASRLR